MTAMVTFRSDDTTDHLLSELTREGETRSDTIRRALAQAVAFQRRELMRDEALALREDEDDLREMAAVLADMEALRAG